MLVLSLLRDGVEFVRINTPSGDVIEIDVVDIRGDKVRLGITAPPARFPIDRINKATGLPVGSPRSPLHASLSDGVAEATLACTGAGPSAPMPRTDAGVAPLVKLGQGTYERAISSHQLAARRAVGSVVDAIA